MPAPAGGRPIAQTPLDRLRTCPEVDRATVEPLLRLRDTFDPVAPAKTIEQQPERIWDLASRRDRSDRVTSQTA
jgi:hypothetical protein